MLHSKSTDVDTNQKPYFRDMMQGDPLKAQHGPLAIGVPGEVKIRVKLIILDTVLYHAVIDSN